MAGFIGSNLLEELLGLGQEVVGLDNFATGHRHNLEDVIGRPLSPYAVTKYVNELYADVFARSYGLASVGLRYFNVFGRRQDPQGAYAAVIPRWIGELLAGRQCTINGDGETSRDFCYIDNVVQVNVLAALAQGEAAVNQVYNVATAVAAHGELRAGDVRHSQADIGKARGLLGYDPAFDVRAGMRETVGWYVKAGVGGFAGPSPARSSASSTG